VETVSKGEKAVGGDNRALTTRSVSKKGEQKFRQQSTQGGGVERGGRPGKVRKGKTQHLIFLHEPARMHGGQGEGEGRAGSRSGATTRAVSKLIAAKTKPRKGVNSGGWTNSTYGASVWFLSPKAPRRSRRNSKKKKTKRGKMKNSVIARWGESKAKKKKLRTGGGDNEPTGGGNPIRPERVNVFNIPRPTRVGLTKNWNPAPATAGKMFPGRENKERTGNTEKKKKEKREFSSLSRRNKITRNCAPNERTLCTFEETRPDHAKHDQGAHQNLRETSPKDQFYLQRNKYAGVIKGHPHRGGRRRRSDRKEKHGNRNQGITFLCRKAREG